MVSARAGPDREARRQPDPGGPVEGKVVLGNEELGYVGVEEDGWRTTMASGSMSGAEMGRGRSAAAAARQQLWSRSTALPGRAGRGAPMLGRHLVRSSSFGRRERTS